MQLINLVKILLQILIKIMMMLEVKDRFNRFWILLILSMGQKLWSHSNKESMI